MNICLYTDPASGRKAPDAREAVTRPVAVDITAPYLT